MAMIDLRSDTVTKPTPAMRRAMMDAEVGDDGRLDLRGMGEDPTVNRLEAMAAALLGKDRALFVPSGTMGNVVALMTHCRRGDEVVVGEKAHVLNNEKALFMEELFGLIPVTIPDPAGMLDLPLLDKVLKTRPIRLVCVENTHNFAGGAAVPPEHLQKVQALARTHRVPVHMDGARLFNAAVALKIEAKVLAATVDSVMFCLSKGLSAPIGSMIVGTGPFMQRAWERRKLLGGQMRQVGVVAAAGIEAIQNMVSRLEDDHQKAKILAGALIETGGLKSPENFHSNMIKLDLAGLNISAKEFQAEMAQQGIKVHIHGPTEIRLVTHKDVSETECLRAARIIGEFWKERRRDAT
jgi:threonine aldolase